jgi:predicted RNA-binding Zn ribbon-like protein
MAEDTLAPGELRLLQEFLNTADIESGTDDVGDAATLRAWVGERSADPGRVSEEDAARARGVREAIRDLLSINAGHDVGVAHRSVLLDAARRAPLQVRFEDGRAALEPAADGIDAFLGQLLAIIARSQADGTWPRLKACHADSCRWAFYDHSRNRSRTWCSMEVCGNRAKARTYRARASTRND